MRINLGVPVYLSGGQRGPAIDRVIVDPRLWEVTHIVVEKGAGLSAPKLVPLDMVQNWKNDRVELRLTSQQLENMPTYVEQLYCKPCILLASSKEPGTAKPPAKEIFTQEGVPYGPGIMPHQTRPVDTSRAKKAQPEAGQTERGPIELRNGALVEAVDGPIGKLDQLLLDTNIDKITYVVVNGNGQKGREVRVPVEWVGYLEPSRIRLSATKQQVKDLVGPPAGNYLSEMGEE